MLETKSNQAFSLTVIPWFCVCEQLDIKLWISRMSRLLYNKHYVALIILYQCCLLMFFAVIWSLDQRG